MRTSTKAAAAITTAIAVVGGTALWKSMKAPESPVITAPQSAKTGAFNRTNCPNGAQPQPNGLCPPHYDWAKHQGFYPPQGR